ncbi:hypothetical protein P7K49_037812 [Saguinus oedipus]|uniref:Uncharacterized protein n=1 Tax=Saguinus oedipus TaxID=9490 RepID=A0ABQ9TJ66_SAGOE|nr:hypothetical protein P7K49_037812 [Saguinus oedipus]
MSQPLDTTADIVLRYEDVSNCKICFGFWGLAEICIYLGQALTQLLSLSCHNCRLLSRGQLLGKATGMGQGTLCSDGPASMSNEREDFSQIAKRNQSDSMLLLRNQQLCSTCREMKMVGKGEDRDGHGHLRAQHFPSMPSPVERDSDGAHCKEGLDKGCQGGTVGPGSSTS